ncbi:MAG TPA: sigma-70 family RNA polymerase sigma factor [Chloroflexota bacterium]|nr:sigma-70 family RNA polymerase sigma factor [Chloroflexota bacterium]
MMHQVEDVTAVSDESLVDRLQRQDVRALEVLYERHARALFSLGLKMLADQEAAEEIVQETFLKLWQRPDSYLPSRGRLLSWLLGVAHHRAVDRLRRRRLELRYSSDHRFAEQGRVALDPEEALLASLTGEAVVRAVRTLPQPQRLAVELAYVRGMTQAEIAALLGEPLGTIKTRLRLAMQKLRASLELAEMRSAQP